MAAIDAGRARDTGSLGKLDLGQTLALANVLKGTLRLHHLSTTLLRVRC